MSNTSVLNYKNTIVVPEETVATAQRGANQLLIAVTDLLSANPKGLRNVEIATVLGICSDHRAGQKNYLSYSLLGILMSKDIVEKRGKLYLIAEPDAAYDDLLFYP